MSATESGPEHWEKLYREGRMPWDVGGVPKALETWVDDSLEGLTALVPGCGSAYEAACLANAGCAVLAVDFSPAAVRRAQEVTAGSGAVIAQADFFTLDQPRYDLIYERAFMCALAPSQRTQWVRQCARLLLPGGRLAGFFFTDPTAVDGPPFGTSEPELERLLMPWFSKLEDRPSGGSLPVFAGRERWQVWQRSDASVD
jgi:SAM-dependent methyltransferase